MKFCICADGSHLDLCMCVCVTAGAPSSASVSGGGGEEEGSARLMSSQHVRTPQRPQVLLCRGLPSLLLSDFLIILKISLYNNLAINSLLCVVAGHQ